MAKKVKFNPENIAEYAFRIVRANGLSSLNARSLAYELGCSTQPIFSHYRSMEEIVEIVYGKALTTFRNHMNKGRGHANPMVAFTLSLIAFTEEEPHLYDLLFMGDEQKRIREDLDRWGDKLSEQIAQLSSLPLKAANIAFLENWVFAIGVANQVHNDMLNMNEKALEGLIASQYEGTVLALKARLSKR